MESTTCWTLECKIGLLSSRARISPDCLSIVILTIYSNAYFGIPHANQSKQNLF